MVKLEEWGRYSEQGKKVLRGGGRGEGGHRGGGEGAPYKSWLIGEEGFTRQPAQLMSRPTTKICLSLNVTTPMFKELPLY